MNMQNPFAAFTKFATENPFAAAAKTMQENMQKGTAGSPFGAMPNFGTMPGFGNMDFSNGFTAMQGSMQSMMQDAMQKFMPGDFFKNWQNAWTKMFDSEDGLHNPSGPFGAVKPDEETAAATIAKTAKSLLGNSRLFDIDWSALTGAQKKNIEALTAANHAAMEGFQQICRRQGDIFRETMQTAGSLMTDMMATGTPEEKLARQADIARRALDVACKHMRELAELATKSQHEALGVVEGRLKESLDELKKTAQASGAQFHSDAMKGEAALKTAKQTAQKTAANVAAAAAQSVKASADTIN